MYHGKILPIRKRFFEIVRDKKLKYLRSLFISVVVCLVYHSSHAQTTNVVLSGQVIEKESHNPLPFVNVLLLSTKDSTMLAGSLSNEAGRFSFEEILPNNYLLELNYTGYLSFRKSIFIGSQSAFLDLGVIELAEEVSTLNEVAVTAWKDNVGSRLEKKIFSLDKHISQSGGSVMEAMRSVPGIAIQDNKIKLRGSDKVIILINGKQSAITGFDGQDGLDNLPASGIDQIEVINNPSSKFDATGSAGIINIKMKKNKQFGWNGKAGFTTGLGTLWERKKNYPDMDPQFKRTPKLNPSLALNFRKEKFNLFAQLDDLYNRLLSSNEYMVRKDNDGSETRRQLMRNKIANDLNARMGIDWYLNDHNALTIAASFTRRTKTNDGAQGFYNEDMTQTDRLWKINEDDRKTLGGASISFEHSFKERGHKFNLGFNYAYTRREKDYDFENILPNLYGTDAFELRSEEKIFDFNFDYVKPFKYGILETGAKLRYRYIPSDMTFIPGQNSIIDLEAGGWADYKELIPALYANYNFETGKWEAELGARLEYVKISYDIDPNHNTYHSDAYSSLQPFFNTRLAYKLNDKNKVSIAYNRRADRPQEADLRIFPKYDDAEVLKVGNPGLRPQYTSSFEAGYKTSFKAGYVYAAIYHRSENNTLIRIATKMPDEDIIYSIFQNAGKSSFSGLEVIYAQKINHWYDFDFSANVYHHKINAFSIINQYPTPQLFESEAKNNTSLDLKINNNFKLGNGFNTQLSAVYFAPDNQPQTHRGSLYSIDFGIKKYIQKEKGEIFFNATDILNTMIKTKTVTGSDFIYTVKDYGETQVFRIGYSYKF